MWVKLNTNSNVSSPPLKTDVSYLGRWFPTLYQGSLTMTAISGGQEIRMNVVGTTTIKARFFIDAGTTYIPYVAFSIDDGAFTRQAIAANGSVGITDVVIGEGLSTGQHKIRLILSGVKEDTARWDGVGLHFLGFLSDEGSTIVPYPAKRKITYIGDSITEGISVLGNNLPAGNVAEKSYAHVSANILGADPIIVAFGGVGPTVIGEGSVPKSQDNYPYYKKNRPVETESPSLIVINLGTNDRNNTDISVHDGFQQLINVLRSMHPLVKIMCMRPFSGYKETVIQQIVSENTNIHYIDTTPWGPPNNLHPNATYHQLYGEKLATAITGIVGANFFI